VLLYLLKGEEIVIVIGQSENRRIGELFTTDKPTFIILVEGGNSHADAK
jgi:hypothetical protein